MERVRVPPPQGPVAAPREGWSEDAAHNPSFTRYPSLGLSPGGEERAEGGGGETFEEEEEEEEEEGVNEGLDREGGGEPKRMCVRPGSHPCVA